jgi:hypothetical protein
MQSQYGKVDGMYWYAVWLYEKNDKIPNKGEPHRVHSEVDLKNGVVILRDVDAVELIRVEVDIEKPRKRAKKSKSKSTDSESE